MLTCHGYMKQYLQTIIGQPAPFTAINSRSTARIARRAFASGTQSEPRQNKSISSTPEQQTWSIQRSEKRLPDTRFEQNRQEWLKSRGTRPVSKAVNRRPNLETDASMKKHFQYLQDPLKLADYIRRTLRNDDFETAEKVVQYASKTLQCVVSWNHLVDWQLSKGRMNGAIKTFNEMKKRAQVPDAHTYTIIFRRCSDHKDSSQALEKVLAIYNSMFSDTCPVKPNTIHVNAVLKMCSKAQNMDAMFAIADHLPEKGLRAANNLTYTTILNGLRMKLVQNSRNDMTTSMQQRQDAQNAILTARHIWSDIVKRWRKGDIWIDEELVCAMGRLLLMGNDLDADDVLSLVEQSMAVPRHTPPRNRPTPPVLQVRKEAESTTQAEETLETTPTASIENTTDQSINEISATAETTPETPTEPEDEELIPLTEHITPTTTPPKGVSAYPIPAQNTLSLIMATLLKLRDHSSPKKYWTHLTSNGLIPDGENYNSYLRTLRITRASSETVKILLSMPKPSITTGTYRIAIATCVRDKNNPHVFANAGKILDLMQTTHSNPDAKVLDTYLEVAITTPVHVAPSSIPQQELELQKFAQGAQISRALQRLGPAVINLKAILTFGDEKMQHLPAFEREKQVSAVLALTQRMVSAYDILMDKGMVPRVDYVPLTQERNKLTAFITRHKHARRANGQNAVSLKLTPQKVAAMALHKKEVEKDERQPVFRSVFKKQGQEKDVADV